VSEELPFWAKVLRDFIFGVASQQSLAEKGISVDGEKSKFGLLEIGATGYDLDKDIQERVSKLLSLQEEAIANQSWQPKDGRTYCNRAFAFIAQGCGYFVSPNDLADTIISRLSFDSRWREDSLERAHIHAMRGGLSVATYIGHPHGHLATFAPLPKEPDSANWGGHVPMVCNIGEENKFMPISEAFSASKRPSIRYFLLTESAA
jgi:hypothetical protein